MVGLARYSSRHGDDLKPETNTIELELLEQEIVEAIGDMVDLTCADMRPLWLIRTHKIRADLMKRKTGKGLDELTPAYPEAMSGYVKSNRTKLAALAGWRHAVVWQDLAKITKWIEGSKATKEAVEAMKIVYFKPCENVPPYTNSQRVSNADAPRGGKREFREKVAEGANATLHELLKQKKMRSVPKSDADEICRSLLERATEPTVHDVLKLTDHRTWDDLPKEKDE